MVANVQNKTNYKINGNRPQDPQRRHFIQGLGWMGLATAFAGVQSMGENKNPGMKFGGMVITYADYGSVRAATATTGNLLFVEKRELGNMLGGGLFIVEPANGRTDNDGTVLAMQGGNVACRVFEGPAHATWFGVTNGASQELEIQAALDAESHIILPAGRTEITASLHLNSGQTLEGVPGASELAWGGPSMAVNNLILVENVSDVTIRNLIMRGVPDENIGASHQGGAVNVTNADRVHISHCDIAEFPQFGIFAFGVNDFVFEKNRIRNIRQATINPNSTSINGITVTGVCKFGKICDNDIFDIGKTNTTGIGIRIIGDASSVVNEPISQHIRVLGNRVFRCQEHGIIMYDNFGADAEGNEIIGNRVADLGMSSMTELGNGIYILQVSGVTIKENAVVRPHVATNPTGSILQAGIAVANNAQNNREIIIANNTVEASPLIGIDVNGSIKACVEDNRVEMAGPFTGIRVRNVPTPEILRNQIFWSTSETGLVDGIRVSTSSPIIQANTIHNAPIGIYCYQTLNARIEDNEVTNANNRAIYSQATSGDIIMGNRLHTNGLGYAFYGIGGTGTINKFFNNTFNLEQAPIKNLGGFQVLTHSNVFPDSGSWVVGDRVLLPDGFGGWDYTTDGTSYFWAPFGTAT